MIPQPEGFWALRLFSLPSATWAAWWRQRGGAGSSLALEITSERQCHAIEPHPVIHSACYYHSSRNMWPLQPAEGQFVALQERGYQLCDLPATPPFWAPIKYKRDDGLVLPHLLTYSGVALPFKFLLCPWTIWSYVWFLQTWTGIFLHHPSSSFGNM